MNLGVKIAGVRPRSISDFGPEVDRRFIESRGRAMQQHDKIRDEITSRSNLQEMTQKIVELKTGNRLESLKLAKLPEAWTSIPRRREPSQAYAANSQRILGLFSAYIADHWPTVSDLASVTRDHVAAYMKAERARGVSAKTWNETLKL